ncbi:uncharacterized protein LOC123507079 [Portunus trituberculatus]|uniref:uncharacterized protein LOC123507079 n=1 Tax=Portunus trituberculatus TaxID=210409 RepID=UPI001E1D1C75|nr:uncharacterized protein LOC123507079 [Portunus trituberculatus]
MGPCWNPWSRDESLDVCGRKASPTTDPQCTTKPCTNLCHAHCLAGAAEFRCGDTGQLRARAGITDPVTYFVDNSQENSSSSTLPYIPPTDLVEEQPGDGLDTLPKEELIKQLRKLRSELATTKSQLTSYRSVTVGLAEKRCVLVEALSIVDTLLATHASEDLHQRSVACTARPHKILDEAVSVIPADTQESTSPSPTSINLQHPSTPNPASVNVVEQGQVGILTTGIPSPSTPHPSPELPKERGQAPSQVPPTPSPHPSLVSAEEREQGRSLAPPPSSSQPETSTGQGRPQNSSSPRYPPQQRPKKVCEYCQGRFHSALDCRVRAANERQQELDRQLLDPPGPSPLTHMAYSMEQHPTTTRRCYKPANSELKIVSANVRGFHTNIGELTHSVIIKKNIDLVFMCKTFLDAKVPSNYARIKGNGKGLLCVGCYRPPSQGTVLLDYLTLNLDSLMTASQCDSVIVIGDLNQHTVRDAFNSLLVVHDMHNYVTFPTHKSGSSLDPVVTDLPFHTVQCFPLDFVGTSDHVAVFTRVQFKTPHEESFERTLWSWEAANWDAFRAALRTTEWGGVLRGDANQQVRQLTELLHNMQVCWVPHSVHKTKASDQPWFGPACVAASDAKYKAWRALKKHPTARNRLRHRAATGHMNATQAWAIEQWRANLKNKLRGGQVGCKQWWSLVKDKQGESRGTSFPALHQADGSFAHSVSDKAGLLAKHFAEKMCIPDPERPSPLLPQIVKETLVKVITSEVEVRAILKSLDENKAVGPQDISPHVLRQCAAELARPLTSLFNHCLATSTWPEMWKGSSVVPLHKKNSKAEAKNYRPVSLLPVLSKVLETIVASRVTQHLERHHLLSNRQFGFRQGRSVADLHLLLSTKWSEALDRGKATAVVALDIEAAFDRVWHAALITKLRAVKVDGALLHLLENYLRARHLKVIINGRESKPQPIRAGVPQGSCLGPLLWNVSKAFADDITLSHSYGLEEEAAATCDINATLSRIAAWGRKWQVKFAAHKTQLLSITRTSEVLRLAFNGETLTPREEVEVLGVTYDRKLTFRTHLERLAREASGKLASLRISYLLDAKGLELLYKSQVRSSLEYACLAWGGAASKHLALLDKVQD